MTLARASLTALTLAATACTPNFKYTPTSSVVAQSKAADCAFDIRSTPPDYPYDELGVLEGGPPVGARSLESFREAVAEKVCAAGGTAVLPEVNGHGVYIRAAVIRARAPQAK